MLTSTAKRCILPFSDRRNSGAELESAAVFALAELYRAKGAGLFTRQPTEKLLFISKIGYPLWYYPRNNQGFIFDGLGSGNCSVSYTDASPAKGFIDNLNAASVPRENYEAFLLDNANYFQRNVTQKKFSLTGLISDPNFKTEFITLRKEAAETTVTNMPTLLPSLEETTISNALGELEKLQTYLKEDTQQLPDCLRLISKTTNQYLSELDFQASAATDEADAKIKAQHQIVDPQVAILNKEYSQKIKQTAVCFDAELESLNRLKQKTEQYIDKNIAEGKSYVAEAKIQAARGHKIYEERWKEKIKTAKKELEGLRKEHKNMENQTKKLSSQKREALTKLTLELDREVKLARQPLTVLEEEKETKLRFFNQEKQILLTQEKQVIEAINKSIDSRKSAAADFEALSTPEASLKSPILFYVPFYLVCYEAGLARRYLTIAPSTVSNLDFSAKIKGVFGVPKLKDLLTPRFKAIGDTIKEVEVLARQNSVFEGQLSSLGAISNLLEDAAFRQEVKRGLILLRQVGWLSERELEDLDKQLL